MQNNHPKEHSLTPPYDKDINIFSIPIRVLLNSRATEYVYHDKRDRRCKYSITHHLYLTCRNTTKLYLKSLPYGSLKIALLNWTITKGVVFYSFCIRNSRFLFLNDLRKGTPSAP